MKQYMTVRFAPDGEWVSDNRGCRSIEEAWEATDDGSKWYFYPIPVVILDHGRGFVTDRQRVIAAPEEDCYLGPMRFPDGSIHEVGFDVSGTEGRTIRTVGRWLKQQLDVMVGEPASTSGESVART